MVWFFEKDADELQLETRLDKLTGVYTVIRRQSDGKTSSNHVLGEEPCRRYLRGVEAGLAGDGWRPSRPPIILG